MADPAATLSCLWLGITGLLTDWLDSNELNHTAKVFLYDREAHKLAAMKGVLIFRFNKETVLGPGTKDEEIRIPAPSATTSL